MLARTNSRRGQFDGTELQSIVRTQQAHDVLPLADLPRDRLIAGQQRGLLLRVDLLRGIPYQVDLVADIMEAAPWDEVDEGATKPRWTELVYLRKNVRAPEDQLEDRLAEISGISTIVEQRKRRHRTQVP